MAERAVWWTRSRWAGVTVTALYIALGLLCIEVATLGGRVTLVWLPAGLALGALLLGGVRLLPWVFLGVLGVNLWAVPGWVTVGVAFGNTAGAWTAWRLLRWRRGAQAHRILEEPEGIKWFALFGAVAGPLVSGSIGASVMCLGGEVPAGQWLGGLLTWAFGDGCGVLVGAPLLLARAAQKGERRRWERWVLAVAFTLLTALVWAAVEWAGLGLGQGAALCVYFPLLAWSALRLGLWTASFAVAAVVSLAIVGVAAWTPAHERADVMLELWLYACVMALTTLLLAAMERANARAQAALKGSEAKLEEALDAADVGLWAWDVRTGEVLWSRQVHRLFGVKPGEFNGRLEGFTALLYPQDLPSTQAAITASLAPDGPPFHIAYRVQHPDGSLRWLEAQGGVTFDADGQPVSMRGTIHDVTARREAEAQRAEAQAAQQHAERRLLEAQRLESLGVLAGGIAHDFNNLLTGIMGNASMIEAVGSDEARPFVEDLMTASRRAADLCRQMLAYSGRGRFEVKPADLSALVREMVQLLHTSTAGRAALHLSLADDLPPVLADGAQLRQVVMNLVINAAESLGDQGGDIWLTTKAATLDDAATRTLARASAPNLLYYAPTHNGPPREDTRQDAAPSPPPGRYVCFEVRDSGCGMTPETQAKIFDPFFTTKFHGRGLGLAAVLGIVRGHRGALLVESAIGQGSTFKLLLPAAPPSVRAAQEPPRARSGQLHGLRQRGGALVVEDDAAVRALVVEVLGRFGFDILAAADGDQGAERLASLQDLRLILLDMTMPGRSTQALLNDARAAHPRARVLVMTGFDLAEAAAHLNPPPDGFLPKPFDAPTLLDAVNAPPPQPPIAP